MGIYIGGDIIKRDIDISNNMTETRSIHQGPILKDKIGAGGMAEVFNCSINREPEGKWVIKQSIYPYVTELQKKFLFEIACATKIAETAPWIVPEINTTHSNETQLCMEKLHNITLRDFINYHYGYLSLKNTIDIAIQICEALALMQCSGGIVHRDLKLDNIMVIENNPRIIIKIIDFGLACDAKNQMLAHGPIGSPS